MGRTLGCRAALVSLLPTLLLLLSFSAAPRGADALNSWEYTITTCYIVIERANMSAPAPPLNLREIEVLSTVFDSGGRLGAPFPASSLTVTMSSVWGNNPAFNASKCFDNDFSESSICSTAAGDPDPRITIGYPCKVSNFGTYCCPTTPAYFEYLGVLRLHNRMKATSCGTSALPCPKRIDWYKVRLLDHRGLPNQYAGELEVALTAFGTALPTYIVQGTNFQCFTTISRTSADTTVEYLNLREVQPVDTSNSAYWFTYNQTMTAWLSSTFVTTPRPDVSKCFDSDLSATSFCSTGLGDPNPRLVMGHACGRISRVFVQNRLNYTGCRNCMARATNFTMRYAAYGPRGYAGYPTFSFSPPAATYEAWPNYNPNGCFAGSSKVIVQELGGAEVAIQDVAVGQHVRCVRSADFLSPDAEGWCELMSWVHAQSGEQKHIRVTFTAPGGATRQLTMSPPHLMYVVDASTPLGTVVASLAQFGTAYRLKKASALAAGDRIAARVEGGAGFQVVAVSAVEALLAEGYYVPAMDSGYMLVDGAVAPLSIALPFPTLPSWTHPATQNTLAMIIVSPVWTTHPLAQPVGTIGSSASWEGVPVWPGNDRAKAVLVPAVKAGKVIDFAGLLAWFHSRRATGPAIQESETLDALGRYLVVPPP